MAKMKRFIFGVGCLHLDREVIDAKTIVKLRAQFTQQIRLRDAVRVNHVCAQCFAPGSDGPNVQVVYVRDAVSRQDRVFNCREIDMRGRAFE